MYANLKLLHTTKNFYLRHSFKPEYLPNPNVYNNPYHPLYFNAREKFDNLEPQLIINITATKKAVAGKATVRNRAVRRVRMATWDLLRERGYTKDGRVRNQKAKIAGEKRDIIGTLAFWPTQEAVKADWKELKTDVEVGLEKFLAAHEIIRAKEAKLGINPGKWKEMGPFIKFERTDNTQKRERKGLGEDDRSSSQNDGWMDPGKYFAMQQQQKQETTGLPKWHAPVTKALNSFSDGRVKQDKQERMRQVRQEYRASQHSESVPASLIRRTTGILNHDSLPSPDIGNVSRVTDTIHSPPIIRRTSGAGTRDFRGQDGSRDGRR
ncbi:hypothetical protein RUND412_002383 [Rhizina undulata]